MENDAAHDNFSLSFMEKKDMRQDITRLISVTDIMQICDEFLHYTRCHFMDRTYPKKEVRQKLARLITVETPLMWRSRSLKEASGVVRQSLEALKNGHFPCSEWQGWHEMESDIHIALWCARKTACWFAGIDKGERVSSPPVYTEVFLVYGGPPQIVASLIAGDLYPSYIAHHVDACQLAYSQISPHHCWYGSD